MKIGIAIPTYNEVTNICTLLKNISEEIKKELDFDITILIIDDNSPDGTAKVAEKESKKYLSKNLNILTLKRKTKDGLGRAYIAGFKKLINLRCDYILQMDADLSHNAKYLPAFIDAASKNTELIVASRYIKGGSTPDWSLHRKLLSKYGNMYVRLFLGAKITDYTGGYNMYSTNVLKSMGLDTIHSTGYGFMIELKSRALEIANSVIEIPIVFNDRQHGNSKIPKNTFIKNLILVPKIKFCNK